MLKFCVLGSGIKYTLSPLLHGAVFKELGVNATYGIEDIPEEQLPSEIDRLRQEYDGFNITKPHKQTMLKHLKEMNSEVNAVNTVKRNDKGEWIGFNTDEYGFLSDLKSLTGGEVSGDVLVIGAGGAAEAVLSALKTTDSKVYVYNRTYEKAKAMAERMGVNALGDVSEVTPRIIVNCASVNSAKESPLPDAADLGKIEYAYDLVYQPRETAFMRQCMAAGAAVKNGLGMLIRQAIRADEIFLDRKLDEQELYELLLKVVESSKN